MESHGQPAPISADRATASTTATPAPGGTPATRCWLRPHNLFAILVCLLGLAYLVLTPPFEVPDEPNHFCRVWQVSNGHVRPVAENGSYGDRYPVSLIEAWQLLVNVLPTRPEKVEVKDVLYFLRAPLKPQSERFVDSSNALVVYAPTSYIPQTVGVLLARLAHGPALAPLYAGRLLSLLAYALLLYWAIRVTPVIPWVFVAVGLSPMALTLAASVSADSTTIAFALLLTALLLRQIFDRQRPLRRGELAVIAILGLLLSLSKLVYFPLVFLLYLVPASKFGSRARALAVCSAVVAGCVMADGLWFAWIRDCYLSPFVGVDHHAQMSLILHHPLGFLRTVLRTYLWVYPGRLLAECYGVLGFLAVPLPRVFVGCYYLLLLLAALLDLRPAPDYIIRRRLGIALVPAAVFGLVALVLYVSGTVVGLHQVERIQGRYFIPILPLIFVLLCNRFPRLTTLRARLSPAWPVLVGLFAIVSALVGLHRLCRFYYGG